MPFVSAAAGLLLASNPQLDPEAVQARLEQHTRDLGTPGWDPTYGYGLIHMAGLCAPPAGLAPVAATQTQPVALPSEGQTLDGLDLNRSIVDPSAGVAPPARRATRHVHGLMAIVRLRARQIAPHDEDWTVLNMYCV